MLVVGCSRSTTCIQQRCILNVLLLRAFCLYLLLLDSVIHICFLLIGRTRALAMTYSVSMLTSSQHRLPLFLHASVTSAIQLTERGRLKWLSVIEQRSAKTRLNGLVVAVGDHYIMAPRWRMHAPGVRLHPVVQRRIALEREAVLLRCRQLHPAGSNCCLACSWPHSADSTKQRTQPHARARVTLNMLHSATWH